MKLLKISKSPIPDSQGSMMREHGLYYDVLAPSVFSALTAMRIAKTVDSGAYDIVEAARLEDAMAAVSARKVSRRGGFKVVVRPEPLSDVPRSVPSEILRSVDLWILPSQRLFDAYPIGDAPKALLQPAAFELPDVKECGQRAAWPVISWIGPITDAAQLRRCIETVDALDGKFELRICGAGNARTVMPNVHLSRALVHTDKVIWLGEEYKAADEIGRCDAAIITGNDITPFEASIAMCGRCLLTPEDIPAYVLTRETPTPKIDPDPVRHTQALLRLLLSIK